METLAFLRKLGIAATVVGVLGVPAVGLAQEIRGVLYEADGRTPANGIVVQVVRVNDQEVVAVTRTRTDGSYRVSVGRDSVQVRALRVGYRPDELASLRLDAGETREVTLSLRASRVVLPSRTIIGRTRCEIGESSANRLAASLFEQAQVVFALMQLPKSDSTTTARVLTGTSYWSAGERYAISHRWAEVQSTAFGPVSPASQVLFRDGFLQTTRDRGLRYHLPGPDFFTDSSFLENYCIYFAGASPSDTGLVGVGFYPSRQRRGIVHLTGILWLRTRGLLLDHITFGYEGLPVEENSGRPGGWLEFVPLRDDAWGITRWEIRMPQIERTVVMRRRGMGGGGTSETRSLSGVTIEAGEVLEVVGQNGTLFSSGVRDSVFRGRRFTVRLPESIGSSCTVTTRQSALHGTIYGVERVREEPLGVAWELLGSAGADVIKAPVAYVALRRDSSFDLCGVPTGRAIKVRLLRGSGEIVMEASVRIPPDRGDAYVSLLVRPIR